MTHGTHHGGSNTIICRLEHVSELPYSRPMGRTHFVALAFLLSFGSWGCGGSSDEDDGQNAATGGSSAGHGAEEGACAEISEACHAADDGTDDLAAECHHVAHENDADGCSARLDECVEFCHEKAPHGHGGAGGAEH